MINLGAKKCRTSQQLSPVSLHDPGPESSPVIASAVKVASSEDLLIEMLKKKCG